MWSVCGFVPLYAPHPRGEYARHIRWLKMMYMTPSRRAIALLLPALSVASSQSRKALAFAMSFLFEVSIIQSSARPSLCSDEV